MKKVLLVGSGGREHALAWKLLQSLQVSHLILAPGGDWAGVEKEQQATWDGKTIERWEVKLSDPSTFPLLATRANQFGIDLAVIGPDNPLSDGIVDFFSAAGVSTFGPKKEAAKIESSKVFAKEIMKAADVPTARYEVFDSLNEASAFIYSSKDKSPWDKGWVLKADGLALGKGVSVCRSLDEAERELPRVFSFSSKVLVEEIVEGSEVSWFAICDGEHFVLLDSARDYKALRDGNQGPNTGGMGCFSPVPSMLSEEIFDRVGKTIFEPVLREMKNRGVPYQGILYAGLMVNQQGQFNVLEFNSRFGDPEAQVLLPRVQEDLYPVLEQAARGELDINKSKLSFSNDYSVFVVAASPGYPESPEKGLRIEGPLMEKVTQEHLNYFCAGVKQENSHWVTSGGRVFGAFGRGQTLPEARESAYKKLRKVKFSNMHYRKDVADLNED